MEKAIKVLENQQSETQADIMRTDTALSDQRRVMARHKAALKRLYKERDEIADAIAKLRRSR